MLFFFPQVFRKSSKMKVPLAFLLRLLRRTSSFPQSGSVCPIGSLYYLSSCFTYFNHRLNWAQTEVCIHDFAYNFKSYSSYSASFSTLITPKIGDGIVLFQQNLHNHTNNWDYIFCFFLPRVYVNNMAFIFSPSRMFRKPVP